MAAPGPQADHNKKLVVEPPEEYDYESLPPNFSLAANMAAGAFAGVAEHSVMYPIDLLKVRWRDNMRRRLGRERNEKGIMANDAFVQTRMQVVNPTPAAIYTGLGNAIATISRAEGYLSLWRGVSSVVLGAGMLARCQTQKEKSRSNRKY